MIDRASQLPEPELRVSAARFVGVQPASSDAMPVGAGNPWRFPPPTSAKKRMDSFARFSMAHRLRDGKSFVAWAEAALRSSSVRRSLRLRHSS